MLQSQLNFKGIAWIWKNFWGSKNGDIKNGKKEAKRKRDRKKYKFGRKDV